MEAVDEGVVEVILVPEGTEGVKVNAPIARLSGEGDAAPPPTAEATPKPAAPPAKAAPPPADAKPVSTPAAPVAAKTSAERLFASPLAKRIASQTGVDLTSIKGSGPHGRIIRADVEAAVGKAPAKPAAAPSAASPAAEPRQVLSLEQMGIAPGSYDLIPLDGMRRTVARRMTDSFRDVPHFPLSVDIEIDNLLASRGRVNAQLESQKIKASVNDLVIKAAAMALKQVPGANASYTPEGLALHHHADIAMAVAIEGGLITPIVRAAETKGIAQIAKETKDLAERARTKKLKPEEFQGGTFTVSNLGMYGIKSFASIINEPQGAILSVGAGEKRAVVKGDALAIATVMTVTLTCDHRVVDGAIGARFLQVFKAMVEDPIVMLV